MHPALALRHSLDADAWGEGGLLLGGGRDVAVLLKMLPYAKTKRRDDDREHGDPQQASPATARSPRRFRDVGRLRRCPRAPRRGLWCRQPIEGGHFRIFPKKPRGRLPSFRPRRSAKRWGTPQRR